MDLNDVAKALVDGMRTGEDTANLDKLYAPDCVSVEAQDFGQGRETAGLDGIKGKHAWWAGAFEMLDGDIRGPFPHGPDRFAVFINMKTRNKETGAEEEMEEVCLYTVANGKIVREEFFYGG